MSSKKIINIGIVAHADAGKTTITEQILHHAGQLRQIGSVDSGTAQTDWLDIEKSRGISVLASSVTFETNNTQINLIDTPGHVDFIGEVERSLRILDAAILVISAVEGVQAQSETLLNALEKINIPTVIFINKIDRTGSDVQAVIDELKNVFNLKLLPITKIENQGEKDCSIEKQDYINNEENRERLLNYITDFDENITEKYINSQPISHMEIKESLKGCIHNRQIIPLMVGSSIQRLGTGELLEFISEFLYQSDIETSDLSGIIYKISHHKSMGKIAHVRMYNGEIKTRDSIYLKSADTSEKVTQIRRFFGNRYWDIGQVSTGDIAGLCGLSSAKIGDVIGNIRQSSDYNFALPLLTVQVTSSNTDIKTLMSALEELSDEDPLLEMEYIEQEHEINIKITGAVQLEILTALLKERYNLDAKFSPPTVIYKETPVKSGVGFEAYTMPKPCWAVIKLALEPGSRGSGLKYESAVPNSEILYRYQNHIETAIPRTLKQGLHNWEVTDLAVTLIGGEHHNEHTHPLDFFLATPMAVMNGLVNCTTMLLEPIVTMRINANEQFLGKVIGDILAMRGQFDSPVIRTGQFTIEATIPVSTSIDYGVQVASFTSGRGTISTKFTGFNPCPIELGKSTKRRGVNPLDRAKWILNQRNALQ